MATQGAILWSTTANNNATADPTVNWAEGMAPSAVNNSSRAVMASGKRWILDVSGTITTGGTSTAYTLTTNATFAAAADMDGAMITFRVGTTNGADVTLAVDGLTARQIVSASGTNVGAGLLVAGCIYSVTYVHANTEFRIHSFIPLTITSLTAETAIATADVLPFYDDSAAANRKITLPNLFKGINVLTAETALATDDELLIYDTSETAANKMTVANLLKIINVLTEDTNPDEAADFLITYDDSASAAKKVKPANLDVSDLVLISTSSASSSTEIDLTTGLDDTYDGYKIKLSNVKVSVDGASVNMRVGTGGGPTFQSGASDYTWGLSLTAAGGPSSTGGASDTKIQISSASVGNAAGEHLCADIAFDNPESSDFHIFNISAAWVLTSGAPMQGVGAGQYNTGAAITGIRFLPSSGNFVSGRFSLYGYKKS